MLSGFFCLQTLLLVCITSNHTILAYSTFSSTYYRHLKCRIHHFSIDKPMIDISRFNTAVNSRSKFNAALSVSLDQSVLPKNRLSLRLSFIIIVAVAAVMSIYRLARSSDEDSSYSDASSSDNDDRIVDDPVEDVFTNFKAFLSNVDVFAPIKNVASWLKDNTRSKNQLKKTKLLSLDIWNVCRLSNIEKVGDEYSKYRFDVTSYPDSVIPLDIGQEVWL